MKLSTITTDNIPTGAQINYLCGNWVCDNRTSKSIQALFIESVSNAGLISEMETDALSAMFKAGLSKLQAALAPDTTEDLDSLLTFMAPDGGGAAKVKQLVQSAKNINGNILTNNQWWDEIFNSFGISDPQTRQSIFQSFAQTGKPAAKPQQPAPTGQRPGAAAINTPGQNTQGPEQVAPQRAQSVADLEALRGEIQNRIKGSEQRLPQLQKMRQDHAQRLEKLAERLKELETSKPKTSRASKTTKTPRAPRAPRTPKESYFNDLAAILLEFPQVKANLPALVEQIATASGAKNITIKEAGLGDRAKQAIGAGLGKLGRNAANLIANPEHATSKFTSSANASQNERIAKLAIQMLTDTVRQQFSDKLQAQNITPQEIATGFKKYQQYDQRLQSGQRLNRLEEGEYSSLQKKLQQVYSLFQPKGGGPFAEQPVVAELSETTDLIDAIQNMVHPKIMQEIRAAYQKNPKLSPLRILRVLVRKKHLTKPQAQRLLPGYTDESPRDALRRKYEKFKADANAGKYSTSEENRIYQEINDEMRAIDARNTGRGSH